MLYFVKIAVDGRVDIAVDAENAEDAKRKAEAEFADADLGELECLSFHAVNAEGPDGNTIDF